jgi:hypothetical protein
MPTPRTAPAQAHENPDKSAIASGIAPLHPSISGKQRAEFRRADSSGRRALTGDAGDSRATIAVARALHARVLAAVAARRRRRAVRAPGIGRTFRSLVRSGERPASNRRRKRTQRTSCASDRKMAFAAQRRSLRSRHTWARSGSCRDRRPGSRYRNCWCSSTRRKRLSPTRNTGQSLGSGCQQGKRRSC